MEISSQTTKIELNERKKHINLYIIANLYLQSQGHSKNSEMKVVHVHNV